MSLIAWYELKEDSLDKSSYQNHITEHNNIQWLSSGSIKYSYFNNSYMKIPDADYLNTNGPYLNKTISVIFNPQDIHTQQVIFKQGRTTIGLLIYIYDRYLYIGGYNIEPQHDWRGSYFSAIIQPNKWYNAVLQLENAQFLKGFLNGKFLGQDDATPLGDHTEIYIGKNNISRFHTDFSISDNSDYFFNGSIIDLKYYNNILNQKFLTQYSKSMLPTTKIVTPKQYRSVEAHKQRIYQFNDTDKNVYLSRDVSYLINSMGNDVVLDGLNINKLEINTTNIEVELNNGILIQDSTLVRINEDIALTVEIQGYGHYVIYTEYSFSESYESNPFRIIIDYLTESLFWDINKNRIVLAVINYTEDEFKIDDKFDITLQDKLYYIRGINNFDFVNVMYDMNRHYNVFTISGSSLIDPDADDYGNIDNQYYSNTVFARNGNLIFMDTYPYYDPRYLINHPVLTDFGNNQFYDIFLENGNLLITNTDQNSKNNPTIKDIGEHFQFLQNEYKMSAHEYNVFLTPPAGQYSLCKSDLYIQDSNIINENTLSGPASNYGYTCGGYNVMQYSYITRIDFSLDAGQAEYKSNMLGSKYGCCANNSSQYGYICAGQYSNISTVYPIKSINRFLFPFDTSNVTSQTQLRDNRLSACSNNSSINGYVCGGENRNDIERYSFPLNYGTTEYNLTLTFNSENSSSHNCSYYGYVVGGKIDDDINRHSFSLQDGIADSYVSLNQTRYNICGNNSSQYGFICGNYQQLNNNIRKFLFITGSQTNITNDIVNKQHQSANNSTLYGYISCGQIVDSLIINNDISKFDFSLDNAILEQYCVLNESKYSTCSNDGVDFVTMLK